MKRWLCLVVVVCSAAAIGLRAGKPARPVPAIERVLIISIDGLRPDRLLLADTPVLHGLIRQGAYTMWAQTTVVAITLPSHVSMLTGVNPLKHGIMWNTNLSVQPMVYPNHPTLFESAKQAGYATALISGKVKFRFLAKPGTLDSVFLPKDVDYESDEPVADEAVRTIGQLKPEVLFVHLPANDKVGHKYGWGSPEQLATIGRADACVGRILAALDAAGLRRSTLVIVTSDHGGAGLTHGPEDARSRNIPWIAAGPGIKAGFDLTQQGGLTVRTEDTCATACWVLGLPVPDYFDGKPVLPAFVNPPKS
ncbi:MAG: alkaline phosphatase family protein [Opitutae bacterium]|nr:alkaline phosphatase family protein [Opitutae bacterium]